MVLPLREIERDAVAGRASGTAVHRAERQRIAVGTAFPARQAFAAFGQERRPSVARQRVCLLRGGSPVLRRRAVGRAGVQVERHAPVREP